MMQGAEQFRCNWGFQAPIKCLPLQESERRACKKKKKSCVSNMSFNHLHEVFSSITPQFALKRLLSIFFNSSLRDSV